MRRPFMTILLAGAAMALAGGPILAQAPAQRAPAPAPAPAPALPAQKPYKTVAVTINAMPRDAAFQALRKELGDIAKRKDRAALAQRIEPTLVWALAWESKDRAADSSARAWT